VRQALFLKALRVTLSGLSAGGKSANASVDRLMEMRKLSRRGLPSKMRLQFLGMHSLEIIRN